MVKKITVIGGEDDPLTAEELMQLEQMGAIFPGGVRISEQDQAANNMEPAEFEDYMNDRFIDDSAVPLDAEILMQLPRGNFSGSGATQCMICMEAYAKGQSVVTLPCSHEFHTKCTYGWFQRKDSCPICRKKVELQ